ncbi:hypothetical protein SAMN04488058_12719 [Deinococcus reticulitermitis]|uniref:Transposase DDE domain-containing protein n=1 Tax=Deinococcus reticulitermitis TaxID=856736 RepID=A0A1H7CD82_9DEIO|nr:hypothetical protein SAMN04488058_12719 [Deinococcus reticulitermitis]
MKRFKHQKLNDALLATWLLSRFVFKHPFPSIWWLMLREVRSDLPSFTQADTRGLRLLERLKAVACQDRRCTKVIVDSMPLPVCRPKRGGRCAFPGARWGFRTQGDVCDDKLHAWVTPDGEIVQSLLRPATLHDIAVSDEPSRRWPEFGGPKLIGDKGSCGLGYVFPPKKNSRYDTGWREDRHPKLRKRIGTGFSPLG